MLSAKIWDVNHSRIRTYPSVLITTVGLLVRADESLPFEVLIPFGSGRIAEINGEGDELVADFVQFQSDLVRPLGDVGE